MYITNLRGTRKDNIFPIDLCCEKCKTEFAIEENDKLEIGYLGSHYVKCPVCGEQVYIYELDGIRVTKDNIKFPDHFYDFRNGVKISNEQVEKYIRKGIEYFRKNPTSFSWSTGTGDTHILILNFSGDEDYSVVVSKGHYETEIDYEEEDYDAQNSTGWDWKNKGYSQRIINNNED